MWIDKILQKQIQQNIKTRPVLLLTGAGQTGKNLLLKKEFPETEYITFDYPKYVETAAESPEYFINQFKNNKQVIFDEIQYVTGLFQYLEIDIDENRNNYGKWLLTGSQQFDLMAEVSESLAGRISVLHLETVKK